MDTCIGSEEEVAKDKDWTVVLLLDHIRSQKHYIKLLERWTHQLQLAGMLLLGRSILVILHGDKLKIKVNHRDRPSSSSSDVSYTLGGPSVCVLYIYILYLILLNILRHYSRRRSSGLSFLRAVFVCISGCLQ